MGDCIEIRAARAHDRLEDLLAQIVPGSEPDAVEMASVGCEVL